MTATVTATVNGVPVELTLDDHALAELAAALPPTTSDPQPDFLTIPEAADLLRCKRQRVDDLLSAQRLHRFKDGSRTLLKRTEVLDYLNTQP